MAIINVYRNLDLDEREIIDAESGKPLFRTVDRLDWENCLIIANGNNVDKTYIIKDDDIINIKQYPSATVAAIVVTSLAVGVIAYGVGVAIKDAVDNYMENKIKESLEDMNDAMANGAITQLPSIRGANNQGGNGKVTPLALGHSLFTPYLCGSYNSIGGADGLDQYVTLLFNLGYNDIDVSNIKVGDFDLASNREGVHNGFVTVDGNPRFTGENVTQIELIKDDRQSSLFPQKVAQTSYNAPIIHTPSSSAQGLQENVLILDKFSALNPQKVEVEINFRSLLSYNDEGKEIEASAKVGLAVSYNNGTTWEAFPQVSGSTAYEQITDAETLAKFEMKSGDVLGVSTFKKQIKRTLRYVGTYNVDFNRIKPGDKKPDKYILIRCVRVDAESTDTRTQNAPVLSAIRTWCFDWDKSKTGFVPLTPFSDKLNGKIQRMAIKMKATQNVKDVLSQVTCEVESCCPIWTGDEWLKEKHPSSNPASVVYNLMTHEMLGSNAYNSTNVDFNKLGELYEYCEEKKIKVSGVLVNQKKLSDVINNVLAIGRSTLILDNNKYSFWIDKPQTIPVTVLNNHNLLPDINNSKSFNKLPQAYLVKFIDKENLWQEGQFYLPMEKGVDLSDPQTVIETIELTWITDYEQAVKQVYYYHASKKLRPETWTRKQGVEGAIANIGDLVLLQDDTISVGIGDGAEIKEIEVGYGKIIGIITDSYFNIPDDTQDYAVTVNTEKGTRTDRVNPKENYTNTFYFKTPISLDDFIQYSQGDIISFGIYEKVTTKALVMGKKQDEDLNYTLTLVPYQEGIYTADDGVIPEYNPQTTTTAPSVDLPIIPFDFEKLPSGENGQDGLTVFTEKSALVFNAENDGIVKQRTINSRVVIQQKGFDVPFTIGNIDSPKGFNITSNGHTVIINVLEGAEMELNGVIEVPINYKPIIKVDYLKNQNDVIYTNEKKEPYTTMTTENETKRFVLYISYAKSIKGDKGEIGADGMTILIEKPTLIYNSDSKGNVKEKYIEDKIIVQQKGVDIPFKINDIKAPNGFKIDHYYNMVRITALEGSSMLDEGTIEIPITYYPSYYAENYTNEKDESYNNNQGGFYQHYTFNQGIDSILHISYAKAKEGADGAKGEDGKRAPKYWGVLSLSPTQNGVIIGDYYINDGKEGLQKARIYRCFDIDKNNIAKWEVVTPGEAPSLYNAHVNDLVPLMKGLGSDDETAIFVNGYFELLLTDTAFIDNLFAVTAFIEQLGAKNITLNGNGVIKSENYQRNSSGWKIDSKGNAEFSQIEARGSLQSSNFLDKENKEIVSLEGYNLNSINGLMEINTVLAKNGIDEPFINKSGYSLGQDRFLVELLELGTPAYVKPIRKKIDDLIDNYGIALNAFYSTERFLYCSVVSYEYNKPLVSPYCQMFDKIRRYTDVQDGQITYELTSNHARQTRIIMKGDRMFESNEYSNKLEFLARGDLVSIRAPSFYCSKIKSTMGHEFTEIDVEETGNNYLPVPQHKEEEDSYYRLFKIFNVRVCSAVIELVDNYITERHKEPATVWYDYTSSSEQFVIETRRGQTIVHQGNHTKVKIGGLRLINVYL